MSRFYLMSCSAPLAQYVPVTSDGRELPARLGVAPESAWLPDFIEWLKDDNNILRVCWELEPETALGDTWGDIAHEYVDGEGFGKYDESQAEEIAAADFYSADPVELSDGAMKLLSDSVFDFVVDRTRGAFDVDMPETTVFGGKLVTGGKSLRGETPTVVFDTITLLSGLTYFDDFKAPRIREMW